jgi:hypothetical protein
MKNGVPIADIWRGCSPSSMQGTGLKVSVFICTNKNGCSSDLRLPHNKIKNVEVERGLGSISTLIVEETEQVLLQTVCDQKRYRLEPPHSP